MIKKLMRKPPYRLPTVLGLIFLLVSLLAGIFLVESKQLFFLKADPEIVPRQVQITNLIDTSFTVSWVSSKKVSSFVKIEKAGEEMTFVDERDQFSGQIGKYTTHYVTIKNLFPSQKYLFKIGSGGKIFDNQGQPYEITTGPKIMESAPPADPVYGKVQMADGQPAEGALVYLKLPNVTLQSALVKASGSWLITLSLARSVDLGSYASYDRETSQEEIFVQGGHLGIATAVFTTNADSPAPTLTLEKEVGLTSQKESLSSGEQPTPLQLPTSIPTSIPTPLPETQASGFQVDTTLPPVEIPQSKIELEISYPTQEELVSTRQPNFFGKGPQKSTLTIILNSPSYFGQVVTDEQGNWSWSPPESLEPGEHKLLVRFQDESGQAQTVEHGFTVLAAGDEELPSFTSTPSATPTVKPTPTLPPRTTQPGTEPGVPRPGILTPTFLVSMMGIGVFTVGIFLRRYFLNF